MIMYSDSCKHLLFELQLSQVSVDHNLEDLVLNAASIWSSRSSPSCCYCWYSFMNLKELAMDAVPAGLWIRRILVFMLPLIYEPEESGRVYYHWLRNLKDLFLETLTVFWLLRFWITMPLLIYEIEGYGLKTCHVFKRLNVLPWICS